MVHPTRCSHNTLHRWLETRGFIRVLGVVHRARCQAPSGGFLPGTTVSDFVPPL